ncbi:MAG: ABC transporter permease [Oscillospiraceae bacterium]
MAGKTKQKVGYTVKGPWREIWERLVQNKVAVFGIVVIVLLIVMAIFAPLIAPYGIDEQNLAMKLQGPSAEHIMGTDNFGRDVFSRIVFGSRISLQVGLISVGIAALVGGALGAIAAFYGKTADNIIMRFMDILMAIPGMLLAIAIAAALGPGLGKMMIAIGIGSVPGYARIVRASVMTVKETEFVEAAKSIGASDYRIIVRHIIPNAMAPIIVQATLGIAGAILSAASLSFLGLGIQLPTPEWGAMLSAARGYLRDCWWMAMFPGVFIMLTVYALNVVGDGLRDAIDPRLRD